MNAKQNDTVIVPKDSVFSGTGKASGKPFTTQTMGLVQANGLTQEFKRFLKNPSEALQQGTYHVVADGCFVDKAGNLVTKQAFVKA